MSWNWLFVAANILAAAGWIALISGVARSQPSLGVARGIAVSLAVGYVLVFASHAHEALVLARNYSILGVQSFFSYPALAVAGWVHYLILDLWLGTWEVESAPSSMPRTLLIAALVLTFAAGPVGLCAYLLMRGRRALVDTERQGDRGRP
jgi:hypothetical protein